MRMPPLAGAATLVLLATPAVAQNVTYDFDKMADFSSLKTYTWVRGTPLNDELNHRRILNAVDSQLHLKGFARVDSSANPDVLIAYHASFNRDIQINGFSSGWGPYRFGANRSGTARVDKILVGTLVVDMVDAHTQTIVWRGSATKEVDVNASPEKRERNINRAVEKLFQNYPPGK